MSGEFDGMDSVPVHLTGTSVPIGGHAPPRRKRKALRTNTYTLTAAAPFACILPQADSRIEAWMTSATGAGTSPVTTPAVPGSNSAIESPYGFPVQVVISGGTISAVTINGQLVGGAAGTYFVPAYGSIAVTYTVAPTWAWSSTGSPPPVLFLAPSQGGAQAAGGGAAQIVGSDTTPIPVNTTDQAWVYAAASYPVTVSVWAIYEEAE